jgi:protein involved in polysaccharide export with SLBB domain
MQIKIKGLFLFLLVGILSISTLRAQELLKGKDLSQVRVDMLSDADISKLKSQLTSSGMTIEQAEPMAIQKGMSPAEFAKLKQRLANPGNKNNADAGKLKTDKTKTSSEKIDNSTDSLDTEKYKEKPLKPLINPLIFGSELYTSVAPSFEPNLNMATPSNYVLGPDDQVLVSVYGVQEYNGDLLVSSEGNISIPNVGQIKVGGLTIEAATQKLKTVMGNSVYAYLKSGGSKLSVTLSKIRSIKVTIIGANRPGTYRLSSLSSVFNALYLSGGPTAFGSFREIELVRNNKVERKVDLYRMLLNGDQSDNIGLKDNDVIRIPAYKERVELQGQLKRPGIFEILPGENFANVLAFASGFTDTAYRATVKVYQQNEKERLVHDLTSADFNQYKPQTGDVIIASKILNRFKNRVTLTGAVQRADVYELTANLKVADLLRRADGLKPDAYTDRGQIIRYQEDLTRSILSFDVKKALNADETNNILLQKEDEVLISSVQDLKDSFKVTIQGEIRIPGQYEYVSKLTLKDLIIQAGGFTDAALQTIEIARLLKRDSLAINDDRTSILINTIVSKETLGELKDNIVLRPFDVITVRRLAGYNLPVSVMVNGQVQYPGPYTLSNSNERVSDVLKRSGGFAPNAYPAGAYLKRYKTADEKEHAEENIKKLQKNAKDSTGAVANEILRDFDKVPLNLVAILEHPGSSEDIFVKERDELYVPKYDAQVKVSGEVLMSTQVPYQTNLKLKDYISAAGGFTISALRSKVYVVYANGRAKSTSHFLCFKSYPVIQPGSEVIIPKKREKKPTSISEVLGYITVLTSLVTTYVLLKK